MTRPHDPTGAGGLREFRYSAWVHSRGNREDGTLKPGERREADRILQLDGVRLEVAFRAGRAVFVDVETGVPVPIMELIEEARRDGWRISGVLIASKED
jgi:hypothetical protein